MKDYTEYIQKLSLKKDDIVLLFMPTYYINTPERGIQVKNFIKKFEEQLLYNNKVVVIPEDVKLKFVEKDDQQILGEDWSV